MAKARKIILETRVFEKVGDATQFFSSMLSRYSVGDRISDVDSRDLAALLDRHDEKAEKIGIGISHFEAGTPPDYPGKCFWLVRLDGSKEDFSFKHCLDPKPFD